MRRILSYASRLFRVPSGLSCRRPQTTGAFLGVSFSFATQVLRVHSPMGSAAPILVPPSVFLALSTVFSSQHFVDLFRPTATSEISLQGFSPATGRAGCWPTRPLLSFNTALRHLDFRVLLRLPIRWKYSGLDPQVLSRSPHEVLPPRVFL